MEIIDVEDKRPQELHYGWFSLFAIWVDGFDDVTYRYLECFIIVAYGWDYSFSNIYINEGDYSNILYKVIPLNIIISL